MQNSPFLKQNKKRQINGGPYARNSTLLCRRDFFFFSRRKFGEFCLNFGRMVSSSSFSVKKKKKKKKRDCC